MILASLVFAFLAAVLHVYIFTMESINWTKPKVWKTFNLPSQEHADITRSLAYNQGFYNLFLAIGAFIGVGLVAFGGEGTGATVAGWTLIFSSCGSMLLAAVVLALSGKANLRPATIQGVTPLLAVALGLIAVAA
ncbi:DUF1304 domain-containing protein [Pseudarthrobacter sp. J75]|uniref:DUF1304 domain-containing protein n=1 Tax=unclassified Pseudarthrobacter TaxID=2647000 RepID=UPI002E81CD68|nr:MULTISPECIES: DUF1304 domain-containing protein [unclassified Pseudarthrobacter]MEE2521886.1 DUF1304 domain-containing protein [Pseudarthrobacter sp. J47]MEE2528811.1 DUF1304 domain-containing protein [Pseudarthrobacter sp. J75]